MNSAANLLRTSSVNKETNPDLTRLALKLATGTGKTTVMGMKNMGRKASPSLTFITGKKSPVP